MASRARLTLFAGFSLFAATALAAETHPHWTYEGAEGPAHWSALSPDYAACTDGSIQSPVDLAEANAEGATAISVKYKPVPLTDFNNGHTIQINAPEAGDLVANGVDYKLVQIHFHAPSEHAVAGKHAPLEAHFVHKSADGKLAVLGVLIVEGKENATLAALFKHLPKEKGEPTTYADDAIDPSGLLPADLALFRYMGSLTTPPCSEGVNWHVLAEPVEASQAQITGLAKLMSENNRPVQALNGRLLIGPVAKPVF